MTNTGYPLPTTEPEQETTKSKMGRPVEYPWDEWLNGNIHRLRKGVDFDGGMVGFRVLVHRTAKARGLDAQTANHEDGERIVIEAKPDRKESEPHLNRRAKKLLA